MEIILQLFSWLNLKRQDCGRRFTFILSCWPWPHSPGGTSANWPSYRISCSQTGLHKLSPVRLQSAGRLAVLLISLTTEHNYTAHRWTLQQRQTLQLKDFSLTTLRWSAAITCRLTHWWRETEAPIFLMMYFREGKKPGFFSLIAVLFHRISNLQMCD